MCIRDRIAGDMIQTGLIKSNNHSGVTNGNAFTSAGTAIDLDQGAISSTSFRITNYGTAEFQGALKAVFPWLRDSSLSLILNC